MIDKEERGLYVVSICFHAEKYDSLAMAQLIVRHLEDVKARLKRRAERHGRSMQEEVRHILRNALKEENHPAPKARNTHRGALREDLT